MKEMIELRQNVTSILSSRGKAKNSISGIPLLELPIFGVHHFLRTIFYPSDNQSLVPGYPLGLSHSPFCIAYSKKIEAANRAKSSISFFYPSNDIKQNKLVNYYCRLPKALEIS